MAGINKAHAKQKVPQGSTHTHTVHTPYTHAYSTHTLAVPSSVKIMRSMKIFCQSASCNCDHAQDPPWGIRERQRERWQRWRPAAAAAVVRIW